MLCFNIMVLQCVYAINLCIKQAWNGIGWYQALSEASCHANSHLTGHMKLMAHDHILVLIKKMGCWKLTVPLDSNCSEFLKKKYFAYVWRVCILFTVKKVTFVIASIMLQTVSHNLPSSLLFTAAYIQGNYFRYTFDLSWCKHCHCCSSSPKMPT